MIGTGPTFGKAVDTPGLIIASTDPLAADSIGARLLGFLPQAVAYIYGLYQDKLGEADPKKMTIKGLDLIEAEKIFKHNMPKWNDVLSELTGISFAQIGFNACFDETSLLPEDELTNSEDDNSVSKSTEFEAESEAETDSVSETEAGSAEIVNTFIEDTTETEEVLVTEENTETEDETEITFSANEEELEITPILQEQYLIHIERIALNLGDATVYEGDSIKLKATVFPNNVIEKVTFSSPNSEIATVDDQGVVTGVGAGTVKIVATAETDENVFATCTIRVLPSEVTEEDSSAYEGEEICDGVWIAGFEPELLYTGTKVTQNVRVYDHKKLLKENIDYVVSYANNIDVATSDKINSPRMIITMRGKYIGKKTVNHVGTVYFNNIDL